MTDTTNTLDNIDFSAMLSPGLGLKTSGRRETKLTVFDVNGLDAAEIEKRESENKQSSLPSLQRIRDSHHRVAQLIGLGLKPAEVSAMTGFSPSYISNLQNDQTMKELIEFYSGRANAEFSDVIGRLKLINLEITGELLNRLSANPEEISVSSLIELLKTTLDRTGHAPVTKSVSLSGELTAEVLDGIKESAKQILAGKVNTI